MTDVPTEYSAYKNTTTTDCLPGRRKKEYIWMFFDYPLPVHVTSRGKRSLIEIKEKNEERNVFFHSLIFPFILQYISIGIYSSCLEHPGLFNVQFFMKYEVHAERCVNYSLSYIIIVSVFTCMIDTHLNKICSRKDICEYIYFCI